MDETIKNGDGIDYFIEAWRALRHFIFDSIIGSVIIIIVVAIFFRVFLSDWLFYIRYRIALLIDKYFRKK